MVVPFAPYPVPPHDPALDPVAAELDQVLKPMGFAAGQVGSDGNRGQVIFCSNDGACNDLVVDLEAIPDWHITDVRYWGYPSDRWHLPFAAGELSTQLRELARTLPFDLT